MDNMIYFLLIGLVAGWLAGLIMKGRGYGLLGNLVIGVIGAFIGGYIFEFIGLSASGVLGSLVMSFVGAVVLLYLVQLVKRM